MLITANKEAWSKFLFAVTNSEQRPWVFWPSIFVRCVNKPELVLWKKNAYFEKYFQKLSIIRLFNIFFAYLFQIFLLLNHYPQNCWTSTWLFFHEKKCFSLIYIISLLRNYNNGILHKNYNHYREGGGKKWLNEFNSKILFW